MQYREYQPSPPLRRFIECFWTISSHDQPAPAEAGEVLPDGSIELVLNFGDAVRRRAADETESGPLLCMVVGQLPSVYRLHYTGRADLLGTRFRPAGAYPFLGLSLHELSGCVVQLHDLLPGFQRRVARELDDSAGTRERIRAVEAALVTQLSKAPPPDPVAEEAVRRIQATAGEVSVSALMNELGVSGRHLERRFHRHVGLRPKLLCRILRFRQAFEAAADGRDVNWSALAAQCGYYDQAHLIRDFSEFAGAPPTQLFRRGAEQQSVTEIHHLSDSSKTTA
jgi:AraC-like DNA-binding protein